ncbi:MAG: DNA polymerase I [Acidobacteriota bacterium]|nr:DNA polymerase I [Acidobacteriota bacterium]
MSSSRERLYLIDGYSNIFRAFYAIRGLSNSRGLPTNAVYGFLNMLRKLLREESPELVGVAFDVSDETVVRKEKYEDYKANRKPMPEDLKPQIPWIRKTIEAHHIPILELEKYEADDVLGTLAKKASAAGYDVVLVSADKDLMQLVDDHVSVFHTGREKLYDKQAVEEDFGVMPGRIVDILALKGDSVDNVPGVPGIGDKGARQLISEFGDLDTLLDRAGEVGRKSYRENLLEHRDKAELSRELVTIHTDLPIDFDAGSLRHDPPDSAALAEICRELEFLTLLEELTAGEQGDATPMTPAEEVVSSGDWQQASHGLSSPVFVAAIGLPEPRGLAVAGSNGSVTFADFHRQGLRNAVIDTLERWLADPDCELMGHDLKEVLRLAPAGGAARAELFDTMLASYLLRSAARAHTLEDIALERLRVSLIGAEEAGWAKGHEPGLGAESILAFAGERVEVPRRLAADMREELGASELLNVYRRIEAPLIPVLVDMEETGVLLDVDFLAVLSDEMGAELATIEGQIYELAGDRFNINSPRQLGEVMFERLGYPVIRKTRKTKSHSTDQATLDELAARGFELPEKILRFRELAKLKSTYVDSLPKLVGKDARLHTRYEQAVAATGRLSSANPNLQNIPIRSEDGRRIRKAFIAGAGRVLLVADYNQIELRVLAHIAEEKELMAAFRAGEDIHATTAAAIFDIDAGLVSPDQRRAAKVINFGILYGMSAFGLAQNLKIGRDEAGRFINSYLERFSAVKTYMDETVELAKSEGKVETLYGRVRWLPDINSRNFNLRENARRMAINARIQGTAADLLKLAMIAVARRLREEFPTAHLLLTVHDELVLEVLESDVEAVGEALREEMQGVAELSVPLLVDLGWGSTWFDAKA